MLTVSEAATAALCLAGSLGSAAAFQSPWVVGRSSASAGREGSGGLQRQRRAAGAAVTVTTPVSRSGVSMVSKMTGKDKKGDSPGSGGVLASVKDKRDNRKTDPDKLDKDSFPILDDLASEEDPNIKVTATAWKWPPLWPYTPDYFDRPDESDDEKAFATAKTTGCLEGSSRESLVAHYTRFITEDMTVLEIGASVDSYFPEGMSFPKVVGMGMNAEEMGLNSRLDERIVQNLNTEPNLPFPDASFDLVTIPNTMEFFTNPRLVMREVYRVLRPEGLCMVPFTSAGAYKEYEKKQIKMWKTMNDAQHMWIMGSFFKFSADAGWDDLKGYDMSEGESNVLTKFVGGANDVYVVQASKAVPPAASDVANTIRNRLYGTKSLDTDDVDFAALRLFATYQKAKTDAEKAAALSLVEPLTQIYDLLSELPPGLLFAPYKAILAEALAPRWSNSDGQKAVLKEGLGLTTPGEELWAPLGEATKFLHPEDRVRLLVDLVPMFEGSEEQREALMEVKDVLPEVAAVLKEKMNLWSIPDLELMTTDLIVTDFLTDKKEGRDGFVEWLKSVDVLQLNVWLDDRKNFKARAKTEMEQGGLRTAAI